MYNKQEQSKKYDDALINWSQLSGSQKDKVMNRVIEKSISNDKEFNERWSLTSEPEVVILSDGENWVTDWGDKFGFQKII